MALLRMTKRDKLGTRATQRLRGEGLAPAVIYGRGGDSTAVCMSSHHLEVAVQRGEQLLKAELDGKEENFLIKDVQYDYLGDHILHVDLARVRLDERVNVTVPIVLRGIPVGVETEDGVLSQHLNELSIECLVTDIPEELRVPVSQLHVNESLRVADLELPEGVQAREDLEMVVASVAVLAEEEVVAPEEAAAAQPEVIGEEAVEEPKAEEEEKPK